MSAANVQDAFAPAQIQPVRAVIQQADLGSLRLILRIDEQPMMDVVAPEGLVDESQRIVVLADLGGKGGIRSFKVARFHAQELMCS